MTIIPDRVFPRNGAIDCYCICHRRSGVKHVMPCCVPCGVCGYDKQRDRCACDREDERIISYGQSEWA